MVEPAPEPSYSMVMARIAKVIDNRPGCVLDLGNGVALTTVLVPTQFGEELYRSQLHVHAEPCGSLGYFQLEEVPVDHDEVDDTEPSCGFVLLYGSRQYKVSDSFDIPTVLSRLRDVAASCRDAEVAARNVHFGTAQERTGSGITEVLLGR